MRVGDVRIPEDRVLLLLEMDLPGEFRLQLEPELEQTGRVLFARELRSDTGDAEPRG